MATPEMVAQEYCGKKFSEIPEYIFRELWGGPDFQTVIINEYEFSIYSNNSGLFFHVWSWENRKTQEKRFFFGESSLDVTDYILSTYDRFHDKK